MFPIAFAIPAAVNSDQVEAVLGVLMIAGSSSFVLPFAYQTNLMVAETAGYSIRDFVRFGGPMLLMNGVVTVVLATWVVWGDETGKLS